MLQRQRQVVVKRSELRLQCEPLAQTVDGSVVIAQSELNRVQRVVEVRFRAELDRPLEPVSRHFRLAGGKREQALEMHGAGVLAVQRQDLRGERVDGVVATGPVRCQSLVMEA